MSILSGKTPTENFLGNLEKADVRAIYDPAVKELVGAASHRHAHFAYSLSNKKKKALTDLGIDLFPNGYIPHSHPFSKTLENHLLFDVLPGIVNHEKFTFCSIKERKFRSFNAICKSESTFLNGLIDGRDVSKYPEVSTSFSCFLRSDTVSSLNKVRTNLGKFKNYFFHDEVHHWSRVDLFTFLKQFRPRRLVFTIVYPTELLGGYANSQNPDFYEYEISKGSLFFFPDGVRSEACEQQLNLGWLFRASQLIDGEDKWTVIRHASKYCHHLFEIVPGDLATESKFFFRDFSVINMSVLFQDRFKYHDLFPVDYNHLLKVYTYLLCLKKPDVESGLAKFRQIVGDDLNAKEFLFFEQFCKRIIERGTSTGLFGHSLLEEISRKFFNLAPSCLVRWMPGWRKNNTFEFLLSLDKLCIEVTRRPNFAHIPECMNYEIIHHAQEIYNNLETFFSDNFGKKEHTKVGTDNETNGFLERIKLPLFNFAPSPWKKSTYEFLSEQLRKEEGQMENHRKAPEEKKGCTIPRICLDPHVKSYMANIDALSLRGNESYKPNRSKKSYYEQNELLDKALKFVVASGEQINSNRLADTLDDICEPDGFYYGKSLEQLILENMSDTFGVNPSEEVISEFHIKKQKNEPAENLHVEKEEPKAKADESQIPAQEGKGEEKTEVEQKVSQRLNYAEMFKFVEDCGHYHDEAVDVAADGNCFFSAVALGLTKAGDIQEMRRSLCQYLNSIGEVELMSKILPNGAFMEHEAIFAFAKMSGLKIVIHMEKSIIVFGDSEHEVHLQHQKNHFKYLPSYKLGERLTGRLSDLESGFNGELAKFRFAEEDFRVHTWRGRRSAFLAMYPMSYGHNRMKYPFNSWVLGLNDILKITGHEGMFNSVLIQWYDQGSSIGLHADNETCYDDDPILTVNLYGEAKFTIEWNKTKQRDEFLLSAGGYFLMPKGFQKIAKHAVVAETDRCSLTFRRQRRDLNGQLLKIPGRNLSGKKNICLIKAVADGLDSTQNKVVDALLAVDCPFWSRFLDEDIGASERECQKIACDLKMCLEVQYADEIKIFRHGDMSCKIKYGDNHYSVNLSRANMRRSLLSDTVCKKNFDASEGLIEAISALNHYSLLSYNAEASRCESLIDCFLSRRTGVCLSETLDAANVYFERVIQKCKNEKFCSDDLHCLIGFAGSGKSRFMQDWLASRKSGNFAVVSPRRNLASDWLDKLNLHPKDSGKVCTFETFIKKEKKGLTLIVLDEVTLFPNGYLDWLIFEMLASKCKAKIILTFDVFQARYYNNKDEMYLNFEHDVDKLCCGQKVNYLYASYRMSKGFFSKYFEDLQLLTDNGETEERIQIIESIESMLTEHHDFDVLLVESQLEKAHFSTKLNCMTFGESQGLTFDRVCILLSESSAMSNDNRWMVALTRARLKIQFCVAHMGGLHGFVTECKNAYFRRIFERKKIDSVMLRAMSNATINFVQVRVGGKTDEVDREDRLSGDPFLKPFIFLGQRINMQIEEVPEPEVAEERCKAHIYLHESGFSESINFDNIRLKEDREFRLDEEVTDQFTDNYNKIGLRGRQVISGPLRYKAIYPRHYAGDDLTFKMAIHKRIRFGTEIQNRQRLRDAFPIGRILYENLKDKLNLKFHYDLGLFESCINDFECKKLEKSKSTIENHKARSDIDWAINDVLLFMKSQVCTKFEKQFVDAKAGQTLACFQHLILVNFAPWCRYLEAQIRNQLPPEIYIHSNKNFDDLNAWVKKFCANDICVESDYESFDASQDEYILAFEICLMRDANVPESVIDRYVDLKCCLGCKLGTFAIMRFTGEFCTFFFNTMANMAFTFCRYEWNKLCPIAFAGDDMCALRNIPERHDLDIIFEKISLKAKVCRVECPMFCGWRLSTYGIVKEPELVYNRFKIAIEDGKVLDCIENYAIEVSYAYRLSERLYNILKSERQIQYHQAVVRFIVLNLKLLTKPVANLFEEQSSDEE